MKHKDILAVLILILLVGIFTSPLLLPGGGALDLFPKNRPRGGNCFDLAIIKEAFFVDHRMPLWYPGIEGGTFVLAHPGDVSLNPVTILLLGILGDEVLVDNMTWVIFYLLGACSMYYLCRSVLNFNISGAFLSSIVFSMNGLFPDLQQDGFSLARVTLLLPLLVACFLKAKENRRFIVYSSMVLAFIVFEASLFVPVITLFLFVFVLFDSFQYRDHVFRLERNSFGVLFVVLTLAFLFSCIKILPLLSSFGAQIRLSGVTYENSIDLPNTFGRLFARLFYPIKSFPSLFVGVLPVALCVLASLVFFKRMKIYIIGLVLAVWISFGPNAVFDLNKMLWYLPVFHEMRELPKYYGLFIVFFVSILSGSSLVFLGKFRLKIVVTQIFSFLIIAFVFANLVWSNIGYLDSFNTPFGNLDKAQKNAFFNMKILNGHQEEESIATVLCYFLQKKNIGLIGLGGRTQDLTSVSPKYFLLPGYAFLMPNTSFLTLPNPFYHGEIYLLDSESRVKVVEFSSGQLILDIETKGPDRLVLNQNYDSGWRTSLGRVEKYNNLLSVNFDKAVNCRIKISFFPIAFIVGFIISLVAFVGSVFYLLKSSGKQQKGAAFREIPC